MDSKTEIPKPNPYVKTKTKGFLGIGTGYPVLKWNGKHQKEFRSCSDCKYLRKYTTWWCTNNEAIAEHNTAVPKFEHCGFWKPCEREEPPVLVKLTNLFSKKNKQ